MATYLDEDQVGSDAYEIGYPHLLLCMGVTVVMGDGSLVGAHFTDASQEVDVAARLRQVIRATPATMRWMYCTGNFAIHAKHGGSNYQGKANLIGYKGKVGCFDSAAIEPKDGTFVKLTTQGPVYGCIVEYKRNEKMKYERGYLPGVKGSLAFPVEKAETKSGKELHRANVVYYDV